MEALEKEVASATNSKKQVEIVLSKANMKLKKEVDTLQAQNKKLGGQVQVLVKVGLLHLTPSPRTKTTSIDHCAPLGGGALH